MAAFRELEAFAQLGTELDPATQKQLDRGYRMVELLKQPQYQPMNVVDQIISIYAGTRGFLDRVAVTDVQKWERDCHAYMHGHQQALREEIGERKVMDEDIEKKLGEALSAFNSQYGVGKATAETATA